MEPLFSTPRLTVRPLQAGDEGAMHAWLSDAEVMRHLEPPFSPEKTREFLRLAGLADPPRIYGVARREDGALIGHLIWHPYDPDSWELGWVLRRDCWGKGYAGELTAGALALAGQEGISALVLECLPDQTATRRIARRFGFALRGMDGACQLWRRAL
ncbi:MAG: GNAT family N-acetyltransferase [Oscillospiraceae bacterium]|nr:GNAT family N-acetyltransferase [Oscillospiraceae bacterium]